MCYSTNNKAKPKTETTYDENAPYPRNGYRTDCNNIPVTYHEHATWPPTGPASRYHNNEINDRLPRYEPCLQTGVWGGPPPKGHLVAFLPCLLSILYLALLVLSPIISSLSFPVFSLSSTFCLACPLPLPVSFQHGLNTCIFSFISSTRSCLWTKKNRAGLTSSAHPAARSKRQPATMPKRTRTVCGNPKVWLLPATSTSCSYATTASTVASW